MYKRKFDTSDVYDNKKVKIEMRVCNGPKCKGKEIPLNQNNFFIVGDNYESVCSRCSEYKRCSLCMEVRTKNNFSKRYSTCKQCFNIEAQEKRNGLSKSLRIYCQGCDKYNLKSNFLFIDNCQENICYLCSEYKICSYCRYINYKYNFDKNKSKTGGYDNSCKECDYNRHHNFRLRDIMTCSSCKKEKQRDEMYNRSGYSHCKICYNIKLSKPRVTLCCNKLKQPTEFISRNLTYCKLCRNKKLRYRYKTDKKYKIKRLLRSATKRLGVLKGSKRTMDLIGANKEFVLGWLNYTSDYTLDIMSYNVHIDHVIPMSSFNLENEEEQYKCCNWKNLRLCLDKENSDKSDKIIPDLIEKQRRMVEDYLCK